jgi:hypothetical protein
MFNPSDPQRFCKAKDRNGVLRDGKATRVSLMMKDAAPVRRQRERIVDGYGRDHGLSQPGYPILKGGDLMRDQLPRKLARDERRSAYARYEDDLVNAWKNQNPLTGFGSRGPRGSVNANPPPGAYPFRPEAVGASCTINGFPGTLIEQDGWLVCRANKSDAAPPDGSDRVCPTCAGTGMDEDGDDCSDCDGEGSIPDDYEDNPDDAVRNASTHTESQVRQRRFAGGGDRRSVDQRMRDHHRNMSRVYDRLERDLTQAWKGGK